MADESCAGWKLWLDDYAIKIVQIICKIHRISEEVLPSNRPVTVAYLDGNEFEFIYYLLRGLSQTQKLPDAVKVRDKFKDHVEAEERRIQGNLEGVAYVLDDSASLQLVTGSTRIEVVSPRSSSAHFSPLTIYRISM